MDLQQASILTQRHSMEMIELERKRRVLRNLEFWFYASLSIFIGAYSIARLNVFLDAETYPMRASLGMAGAIFGMLLTGIAIKGKKMEYQSLFHRLVLGPLLTQKSSAALSGLSFEGAEWTSILKEVGLPASSATAYGAFSTHLKGHEGKIAFLERVVQSEDGSSHYPTIMVEIGDYHLWPLGTRLLMREWNTQFLRIFLIVAMLGLALNFLIKSYFPIDAQAEMLRLLYWSLPIATLLITAPLLLAQAWEAKEGAQLSPKGPLEQEGKKLIQNLQSNFPNIKVRCLSQRECAFYFVLEPKRNLYAAPIWTPLFSNQNLQKWAELAELIVKVQRFLEKETSSDF